MIAALAFIKGAIAFAMSPIGRLVVTASLCLSVGFYQGWSLKSRMCEAANLRAELAAKERDLTIQRDIAAAARSEQAAITLATVELQQKVTEYEEALAKAGQDNRCRRSADELKRLRNIR